MRIVAPFLGIHVPRHSRSPSRVSGGAELLSRHVGREDSGCSAMQLRLGIR